MKNKKYAVIVHAAAVNEWTYEVLATSQKEAEKIIREGLKGDRELPDPPTTNRATRSMANS
jgi:hypothetical protein